MKKILNILTLKEPGGVQQREFMFRPYAKKHFEIKTVFLYKKIDNEDTDSFCLYHQRPNLFQLPLIFYKLVILILSYRPDIIMTWGWTANSFGVLASLVLPICKRVVMQVSTAYEYKLLRGYLRITGSIGMYLDRFLGSIGLYDLNIMVSEHNMNSFRHYSRSYLSKCVTITNGVCLNNEEYKMPQFIEELKGRKLIGSVGRLTGVKNHITIVRALSYIPEVTYIIVGQGPLKEYLLSEALKCNVGDRFFIIDTLEHCYINGFLSMLSVFMFPSLSEAFGLAVIEAAAIPLPIVTINAAWVEDTLGSSFTTKVDSNPQSIAEITKSIIYNDKYASSLKAISYSIASKYDFSKMADSYMNKLIDLIGG